MRGEIYKKRVIKIGWNELIGKKIVLVTNVTYSAASYDSSLTLTGVLKGTKRMEDGLYLCLEGENKTQRNIKADKIVYYILEGLK